MTAKNDKCDKSSPIEGIEEKIFTTQREKLAEKLELC